MCVDVMRYWIDQDIAEQDPGYGATNEDFFAANPLCNLIKEDIVKQGPMRFDRYWELSQYTPQYGAYQKIRHFRGFYESEGSNEKGTDYALAQAQYIIEHSQDEKHIRIIECGAGTGDFMLRLFIALKHRSHLSIEFYILEKSASLILTQKHKLKDCTIRWVNHIFEIPCDEVKTFILCEMVLDSFPHRGFIKKDETLYELYLDAKGALIERPCDETFDYSTDHSTWKKDVVIFRSFLAEQFALELSRYFKRGFMISVDHCIETFSTSQLHLVTPYKNSYQSSYSKPIHWIQDASYFLMACSIYKPFYQDVLKEFHVSFHRAKTFFYNIGDYHVYKDDPRFYVMQIMFQS